MKKIITLFAFILFAVALMAQDKVLTPTSTFSGIYNATAVKKTAAYSYVFKVDVKAPYYYSYGVHLRDESATPTNQATVVIAGSLDNVYYKTITTVTYKSAGTDTTIIGNITSSPVSYPFIKFTTTPSDTIWVKSLFLNAAPLK